MNNGTHYVSELESQKIMEDVLKENPSKNIIQCCAIAAQKEVDLEVQRRIIELAQQYGMVQVRKSVE